jgi:carbon storage regulator
LPQEKIIDVDLRLASAKIDFSLGNSRQNSFLGKGGKVAMLVLTRKIGESILIGDTIKIVVLEVRRRQIRLGIESPPDMVVLREEIARRLTTENM